MTENAESPAYFSPQPAEPEPFQLVMEPEPEPELEPENPSVDPKEMQIVGASKSSAKGFKLPSDWLVEVKPRPHSSPIHSDKYYYEPGTGRKFRSLVSIKRYLDGEMEPLPTRKQSNCIVPYDNSGPFKRVKYGGKLYRPDELEEARYTNLDDIYPETVQFRSADTLPDGWIVEEIPRKGGLRSDRYYIDPATGLKFRSMPEVRRFLEEQTYIPKRKALTLHNRSTAPKSSIPRKKNNSKTPPPKDTLSDPMYPPKKINWVYTGESKDDWSPLLEECALPNYMTEQWSETFLLGMNGWNEPVPLLTMKESNQG